MNIAIGCDHAAFDEKNKLIAALEDKNLLVKDFGCYSKDSVDYPDYANLIAKEIQNNCYDFGILICGSGIGISIAANRHKGIRAALCHLNSMLRCLENIMMQTLLHWVPELHLFLKCLVLLVNF